MSEIVNLRRFRKQKAREDTQKRAAENRALNGASKTERQRMAAEASIVDRRLEGHRREAPDVAGREPEPAQPGGKDGKA